VIHRREKQSTEIRQGPPWPIQAELAKKWHLCLVGKRSFRPDAMGNRISETVKDDSGSIVSQQTQVFDELGRVLEAIGAEGQTTVSTYDAEDDLLNLQNPLGHSTGQSYDALRRLVTSTDALSGVTQITYDPRNNITSVEDARSLTTTYQYNEHNQVIQRTSPDTGITQYAYDHAGNVTQMTDAQGVVTLYTYDALNRLATTNYPASPSKAQTYYYDHNTLNTPDNALFNAGIGRLTRITDETGTTQFRYDDRGNLLESKQVFSGLFPSTVTASTEYDYDTSDNLISMTYPSGLTTAATRDAHGRISGINVSYEGVTGPITSTVMDSLDYSAFGRLESATYGNSLTLSRSFDSDWRLQTNDVHLAIEQTIDYDLNSNITNIGDGVNATYSQAFNYDTLDRLNQETRGTADTGFSYDAVGNRTGQQDNVADTAIQTLTYGTTSNRLITENGSAVVYDQIGNITSKQGKAWAYGADNRMQTYSSGGQSVASYRYNALGQRSVKIVSTTQRTTLLSFNQQGQIIEESIYNTAGEQQLSRAFVWLDDAPIAIVQREYDAGHSIISQKLVYLHTDHLNTPRAATNSAGQVVWRWRGSAFGEGDAQWIDDGGGTSITINLRFPGQYFDQESGTHYNYYRDYDASTGRYIQSDPIGLDSGPNTYLYSFGNAVNLRDPNGLEAEGSWHELPNFSIDAYIPSFSATKVTVTLEGTVTFSIACREPCSGENWMIEGSMSVQVTKSVEPRFEPSNCTGIFGRISSYYCNLTKALKKSIDMHPAAMAAREALIQSMNKFKESDFPTAACNATKS